jgi:hypothetical protein
MARKPSARVGASEANELAANVFTSAKTRSTFNVDFSKMDKWGKKKYIEEFFGCEVFEHQVDPADVLTDPFERAVAFNASRQTGKTHTLTWAQGINAALNLYPALDGTTKVIGLANKESQSLITGNRLRQTLERNYNHMRHFWDRAGSTKTHLVFKKEAGVNTREMGTIQYLTANPRAFSEGFTASLIFVDESGRLDPKTWSEVILPYGSSTNARMILTGVSRGKGPFYDACNSKDYRQLHYPWDKVDTYRRGAPVDLLDPLTNDIILKTGYYPLDMMPINLKKVLFPTNPICHILPTERQKERYVRLWELSDGKMTDNDYRSQYLLEWIASVMAILQMQQIQSIFESSNYEPLDCGIGEQYYFGLDLAGTKNLYAVDSSNKDTAALSIWTKRDGKKTKVWCGEQCSSQPDQLVHWLKEITHPEWGLFPCVYGAVDVTATIGALASEHLVASKLPVIPIIYNRTEETTKKNYKNAMFDYAKIEATAERVQYPRKEVTDSLNEDTLQPLNPVWFKCREQWEVIEKDDSGRSLNAVIGAPSGEHDDHPNSDVMAIFVMDRPHQFEQALRLTRKRPRPMLGARIGGGPSASAVMRASGNPFT